MNLPKVTQLVVDGEARFSLRLSILQSLYFSCRAYCEHLGFINTTNYTHLNLFWKSSRTVKCLVLTMYVTLKSLKSFNF